MTEPLVDRLLRGEPAALARAITAVETESEKGREILRAIQPRLGRARLVGVTGPPGAGKSTLVGAYIGELLKQKRSVGVIAVDPSSPISGGAILGDRLRMTEHAGDPAVFIRSLASRGHLGGLSPAASRIADLMDAAGKDVVILETVGAGQSEVEVAEVADVAVVVCAPGLGDDVQAIKAGILEIADVLVVNKADLPLADRTRRQLRAMLKLRAAHGDVAVLATIATSGEGVAALAAAIEAVWAGKGRPPPGTRLKRIIAEAAAREMRARALESPRLTVLAAAVERGELDVAAAASQLVRALGEA